MTERSKFQDLLNQGYLEWQLERGEPTTKKEWANYVGINYTMMSHYFAGRREPTGGNLTKLTLAIGPRVLTSLGLIKDPMLKFVLNNFHDLSENQLKEILSEVRTTADAKTLQELPETQTSSKHIEP